MKTQYNPIAVTKNPTDAAKFSICGKSVVTAMTGNAHFTGISLVAFIAALGVLDAAIALAGTKAPGSVEAGAAAHWKAKVALKHVRDAVQAVVETQTTAIDAIAIIHSAAMFVKRVTKPSKPVFAAKQGATTGEAALAAKAVPRARSYYWMYSLDQVHWTSVTETTKASTTIAGLTAATTYYFRFRTLTKNGLSDYSQVVSLLVH